MFGDLVKTGFFNKSDDTFTFFNPAIVEQTFAILGSKWVTSAFPTLQPIDSTIIQNPSEFEDYQELINDKEINPKNIKALRILVEGTPSQKVDTLGNPLFWQRRRPDGNVFTFADFPVNLLPLDQYQSGVVDVYYKNLIVGLNEFFAYTIKPLQSVTMTFVYEDFRLENLLNDKGKRVVYSSVDRELFEKLL